MSKRIVCLYGGPGLGKSTTCAGVFYQLKQKGYRCEMNREYVKEWVWEGRKIKPGDQTYFFAKAARKERQYMEAGLDFIITDSPLILTHLYGTLYDTFEQEYNTSLKMLEQHHAICRHYGYKVDHFLLKRSKTYEPLGRNENEEQAKDIDGLCIDLLKQRHIRFTEISGSDPVADILTCLS